MLPSPRVTSVRVPGLVWGGGWLAGNGVGGVPCVISRRCWALYNEVQCIMGNGHMSNPVDRLTDGQTCIKT